MEQGPWSLDGKLLLLKEIIVGEQPAETVFDRVQFWIKANQLPMDKRRKSMVMAMANKMGSFVDFDTSDPFGYKKYTRFRVEIDPSKPILRGMKVLVANVHKWVEFRYEKLPDLCYLCGRFGHCAKECGLYDEKVPESAYPYGSCCEPRQ
ncbi:Cellular nucleic acid-binding protein [Bienertia sinuspersici]